jgi:hypothetical protein
MGVSLQAATVIATITTFNMDRNEKRGFLLINIVDIKEKIRLKALLVLQTTYKLK